MALNSQVFVLCQTADTIEQQRNALQMLFASLKVNQAQCMTLSPL